MNRNVAILIAVVALAVKFSTATSQQPPAARRTVFSTLKIGQAVTLMERAGLFEIGTTDEAGPLPHKVLEIADDYLGLRDEAETIECRTPVTGIRAVVPVATKPQ